MFELCARVNVNYKQKPQTDKIPDILRHTESKRKKKAHIKYFAILNSKSKQHEENIPTFINYRELECVNKTTAVASTIKKKKKKQNKQHKIGNTKRKLVPKNPQNEMVV